VETVEEFYHGVQVFLASFAREIAISRAFRNHLTGHDVDLGRLGLVLTLEEKQVVVKYFDRT
jgi:hypothetical protein